VSDARGRELGRRAAAGDPLAAAAWLRHRFASGELDLRRLRVAAYLGHPPAVLVYEETLTGERLRPSPQTLGKWLRGLTLFGGVAVARRVAVAGGRAAAPAWEAAEPVDGASHRALVDAAAEWAACPCAEHNQVLLAARTRLDDAARRVDAWERAERRTDPAGLRAARLRGAGAAARAALAAGSFRWADAVHWAVRAVGEAPVRAAVEAEVAAWAFG